MLKKSNKTKLYEVIKLAEKPVLDFEFSDDAFFRVDFKEESDYIPIRANFVYKDSKGQQEINAYLVKVKNQNIHTLFSYGKPIISMLSDINNGDKLVVHIEDKTLLTQTTLKHIRDFLFQYSHYNAMTEDNAKAFKKDDIMSLMFYDFNKLKELK